MLPFGLRSAPCIFNSLAEAIEWLAKQSSTVHIHHYFDDFFLGGEPGSEQCAHQLHSPTTLCTNLGVPLAEDKMEGPSTTLEYLGITLDSANLEARLSPEKLQDIHTSLDQWSGRQHCAKSELLSLIGTLSFAAKVVPAGRTFLRRMIDLSMTVHSLQGDISLTPEFRSDLAWWRAFARPWSGRSFFLSPPWTPAPDMHLYTDSSSSLGFGAYCHGRWFNGEWDEEQMAHSIQWKDPSSWLPWSGDLNGPHCGFCSGATTKLWSNASPQEPPTAHTSCTSYAILCYSLLAITSLFLLNIFPVYKTQLLTLSPAFVCRTSGSWHPQPRTCPLQFPPLCPYFTYETLPTGIARPNHPIILFFRCE